jgi:outer membrane murein-binding lipoprotein Lpp
MQHKVPSDRLAATVAQLTVDVGALDRGVIDAGLTASQAPARAEGTSTCTASAWPRRLR